MIYKSNDYSKQYYNCQYLVIGTGAGGSIAGSLLTEKKYDVILLEEGGYYPKESFVSSVSKSLSTLYREQGVQPLLGSPSINIMEARCVGGGPVLNGGLLWRPMPSVLKKWQRNNGLIGYGYSNLEKHFKTVEHDLNVEIQDHDLDSNLDSRYFLKGAERLGWKTVNVPRAVKNCSTLNHCMLGCPTGAKQSTLETYIPWALEKGARLFTNCRAIKIEHSGGKAYKVIAQIIDDNNPRKIAIKFDYLVIAGGAIQTPHLLKRSKISDIAGKGLQFNLSLKTAARFKEPINAAQNTPFTIQIQEFLNEGMMFNVSQFKPSYLALSLTNFSNKIVNSVLDNQKNMALYIGFLSSLSKGHIISKFNKKPFLWYNFNPNDLQRIKLILRRLGELLFQSGAVELYLPIAIDKPVKSFTELNKVLENLNANYIDLVTVHIMSSCPMGPDPTNSVVNLDGKVWGMENILVCDASILPSSFGESPQETVMAFAHKIIKNHLQQ